MVVGLQLKDPDGKWANWVRKRPATSPKADTATNSLRTIAKRFSMNFGKQAIKQCK